MITLVVTYIVLFVFAAGLGLAAGGLMRHYLTVQRVRELRDDAERFSRAVREIAGRGT